MKELSGSASAEVSAPIERCYELLADIEGYPRWHPDVVREAQVVERAADGSAQRARTKLHAAFGPLVRDFDLLMAVQAECPALVVLTRIPHDSRDNEQLRMTWRLNERGAATRIELKLDAALSVPRLVPVGGLGDALASGFVDAARRALQ